MNYTEHWVQKIAKQKIANQLLAEKARSDVQKIVEILVNDFNTQQIILFGSLLSTTRRVRKLGRTIKVEMNFFFCEG